MITVRYFAVLRERAGVESEQVEAAGQAAASLYARLRERHGFALPGASVRVARNGAFVPFETLLEDGDEVVFIPPVSGG